LPSCAETAFVLPWAPLALGRVRLCKVGGREFLSHPSSPCLLPRQPGAASPMPARGPIGSAEDCRASGANPMLARRSRSSSTRRNATRPSKAPRVAGLCWTCPLDALDDDCFNIMHAETAAGAEAKGRCNTLKNGQPVSGSAIAFLLALLGLVDPCPRIGPDDERPRVYERRIPQPDQDAGRAAMYGGSVHASLGVARLRAELRRARPMVGKPSLGQASPWPLPPLSGFARICLPRKRCQGPFDLPPKMRSVRDRKAVNRPEDDRRNMKPGGAVSARD